MLWLALRFPHLALEAVDCAYNDSRVLAVTDRHRIFAATKKTEQAGIQPGMKATSAHALADVQLLARNRDNEAQLLQQLAAWAYGFTPYIQRHGDDCLLLEISRCLRLFGGVENFCRQLAEALSQKTPDYRLGLAHSRAGAWLLSQQSHKIDNADSQALFMQRIGAMPLDYLQDFPDVAARLGKMGLHSFGEMLELPRAELGKRFGQEFIHWLNELEGKDSPALSQTPPQESFQRSIDFAYAVDTTAVLEAPAARLLQDLVDYLVSRQLETRQIDWYLYSPQGQVHSFSLGAERIHGHKQLLLELTRIRLGQLKLMFPVERMELRCAQTSPLNTRPLSLFADDPGSRQTNLQQEAESLAARLQTHIGQQGLLQFEPRAEHLPEQQSARVLPFKTQQTQAPFASTARGPRPVWLFKRPQKIQNRNGQLCWTERGRQNSHLHLIQGPERIEDNWWHKPCSDSPGIRDYFVAERDDHVRYWVYHDWQDDRWYAQGVFA